MSDAKDYADMDRAMSRELSDEVYAIARARAAEDRELLARLVREGKVIRTGEAGNGGRASLVRAIEEINRSHDKRQINLAIRPKRKKGGRR